MKRCPTCNKTFTDRNLSFCIEDGTPLVPVENSPDEVTVVSPSARDAADRSTGPSSGPDEGTIPPYQPPGSYASPGVPPRKRRIWSWILGLLLVLLLVIVGMGAVAWFYFQPLKYVTANTNTSDANANVDRGDSNSKLSNSNSNSIGENQNTGSGAADETPAPTDQTEVLADLTNLEHEWTVANINADKKKLVRILADDYVGTSAGRSQGKAEYLSTIKRDPEIDKWEFEDLKVSLEGDRATLAGIQRQTYPDREDAYRFVDKFVWRDGRWQATGSEVTAMK